ncbi:hypothetical protein BDN67DRAFT_1067620 [Paxillus ammoniavirescens]|nr:hypothetical protein BDN67DRAFT_1067620 [Paxillus ammoniavirescens]
MLSESIESLVAERVAELEAIAQRRNELLRQMYHMMRRRHQAGSVLSLDAIDDGNEGQDEDEGLREFLDMFDLHKNPESGMVYNLSDSELFIPSTPLPLEGIVEETEKQEPAEVDSPMSEPPASPTRTKSPPSRLRRRGLRHLASDLERMTKRKRRKQQQKRK